MREQMAVHRTSKSCFSCHGVLDPIGLALENFDGVGRWREKDRLAETRVDPTGVLPDGTEVKGPVDLRNALMKNPDQFVQTLVTKMMIYASGRPMEWQDMPTIRAIVKQAAADDYRFAALVTGIVKSAPFRMKQVPVEARAPETRQAAAIN
jgi:hypothetical protein